MKRNDKSMTLRGSVPAVVNRDWFQYNILEYSNVLDLSKAWKVIGYSVWPTGWREGFQAENILQHTSIESFLATDIGISDTATIQILNSPEDNRQIAWGNTLMNLGSGDKVSGASKVQSVEAEHYWIDPNHIIQDELNLYLRLGAGNLYEGSIKQINYIVFLEEYEISDVESIVYNLKGKAQDLSN
ncbi:unnamed protein product [marine sediment metagenome]|uniref:Uncharacterized protein n=1 Tax=marine sediment metagenome TaxID=412755 RepID=X1HRS8_9ZZZZ